MKDIFWDIKSVNSYENVFYTGIMNDDNFNKQYELIKNLSYNVQYLEFLNNALRKDIHSSLFIEFTKTFVITGMSIVESLLYYFIKKEGFQNTTNYIKLSTITSNKKMINNSYIKVETKILKELEEPAEVDMKLDTMLKKVESKEIFGKNHTIYAELNRLRKLRNKIHLHDIEENLDHDFNNFGKQELNMMKRALCMILFSDKFSLELDERKKVFDFLIVTE